MVIWTLPSLLSRAGFEVDLITSCKCMRSSKFIRSLTQVPRGCSLIPIVRQNLHKHYDWVVVADDKTLHEIKQSDLSVEEKLRLLPVLQEENFTHLFSKIELSHLFKRKGILTPTYGTATNRKELAEVANRLGYPLLLKQDASGGGSGIVECKTPDDLAHVKERFMSQPLLVQKKIAGFDLDLSALFLQGKLIHFSYAKMDRVILNAFGPSVLRTYSPLQNVERAIFDELKEIGQTLGAHGFVNLACIDSGDRRYYFEADMRPNVWVEISRMWGEDPADRIRNWFRQGQALDFPKNRIAVPSIQVPYFLRMARWELLTNRFGVWKWIPKEEIRLVVRLIIKRCFSFQMRVRTAAILRILLPPSAYAWLKMHVNKLLTYH